MLPVNHSLPRLVGLALAYRVIVLLTPIILTSPKLINMPLFDTSPDLLLPRSSALQALVRWDVVWFLKIAGQGGYKNEQETAFGWGWIWTMRIMAAGVGWVREAMGVDPVGRTVSIPDGSGGAAWEGEHIGDLVIGGAAASWIAGIAATVVLHRLTLRLTRSPLFAHLTSLLYLLSPSPGALVSPYTEPLYAFLTFSGMLATTSSQHLVATALFALATSVRPLGVMNAGYVIWGLVVEPWIQGTQRSVGKILPCSLLATLLTLLIASPFIASQRTFYTQFCVDLPSSETATSRPPWCDDRIPLLYPYVQKKYWNVGLLRYFHPAQIPNFLVAAPIYLVLAYTHWIFLPLSLRALFPTTIFTFSRLADLTHHLPTHLAHLVPKPRAPTQGERTLATPAMVPYLIHSVILSGILFWASHVQIALRLAQTMPVVWWGIAALVTRREGVGEEVDGRQDEGDVISSVNGAEDEAVEGVDAVGGLRRRARRTEVPPVAGLTGKEWDGQGEWRMHRYGKWYLRWVVVWGMVATVLWAGFFPPA